MADAGRPAGRSGAGHCCKVGRGIDRYGLASMDERLASRWGGRRDERVGLRDLAAYYNRSVLRAGMQEAGLDPLRGEVEDLYDRLLVSDPTERTRIRARSRLERADVDAESLRRDFVSHTTVGTHLKECLGVEPPTASERDGRETVEDRVSKLQHRSEAVVQDSIDHLRDVGAVSAPPVDVFASTTVVCSGCGTQYDVLRFIERGGCDCEADA